MKALILNSGMGKRMRNLTSEQPKCMTNIENGETIISRQLKLLMENDITEIVMTTGPFDNILADYCHSLKLPLTFTFVKNPIFDKTNYIYSIYLARDHLVDDIILMHGDLVFDPSVIEDVITAENSCMAISSSVSLPQKDFKAVIKNSLIKSIGIEYFEDVVTAQPLYKIQMKDWKIWLESIVSFCEKGQVNCYAESAFNEVSDRCHIYPMDYEERLCAEIDTPEDLKDILEILK